MASVRQHPSADPAKARPARANHPRLAAQLGFTAALMVLGSLGAKAVEPPSSASSDAAEALVSAAALTCTTALASRYSVPSNNVDVWLTPGERIAIDSGDLTLAAMRQQGLQFGWMVRGRSAPAPIGVCRTKGDGSLSAIDEQKD